MTKFNISSRGWILMACAGLILMFGAIRILKTSGGAGGSPVASETEVPLNTLTDETPPPMPSDLDSPALSTLAASTGGDSSAGSTSGDPVGTSSTVGTPAPLDLPIPPTTPRPGVTPTQAQQPVVWVSEDGASAYAQPGFNMPKVRELKKWEELQIVESTQEAWDRVRDEEGQEFWVQKKLVTIIRPRNLSQPSVAETKVMDFYTKVSQGDHSEAYTLLSPEWKKELSFNDFVTGYSRTDSLRSEIVNVFQLGEDRYQVDVSMEAVEEGDPIDYLGIYTVEKLDGKWFLSSGSLKRQVRAPI